MSNRIIHFEIQSAEPEKASKFYEDVFGWEIKEWEVPGVKLPDENRYWLITTGKEGTPGINGGMLMRRGPAPAEGQAVNAFTCVVDVSSIDESVEKIKNAGGTMALPKMAVPGVGWVAYAKDLDGNIFGLMQEDKNAK